MKLFILFGAIFLVASSFAQNATCPDGQALCEGTVDECVPEEFICDGTFIDCSNDADEQGCSCGIDEFTCPDSGRCIPITWICDGDLDCPGGEDEATPCPPCPGFQCNDGECIPGSWKCDGFADCSGREDEGPDCPPIPCNAFKCEDSGRCIPGSWICDEDLDCNDGSDEANCTMAAVPPVALKGTSMMTNGREVKMRKPATLATLSKRKMKRTQKKMRKGRRESFFSRRSQIKSRQWFA